MESSERGRLPTKLPLQWCKGAVGGHGCQAGGKHAGHAVVRAAASVGGYGGQAGVGGGGVTHSSRWWSRQWLAAC